MHVNDLKAGLQLTRSLWHNSYHVGLVSVLKDPYPLISSLKNFPSTVKVSVVLQNYHTDRLSQVIFSSFVMYSATERQLKLCF